jgi:hypothetical protein
MEAKMNCKFEKTLIKIVILTVGVLVLTSISTQAHPVTTLSDGSAEKNVSFITAGDETVYLKVPKNANVIEARLNITGVGEIAQNNIDHGNIYLTTGYTDYIYAKYNTEFDIIGGWQSYGGTGWTGVWLDTAGGSRGCEEIPQWRYDNLTGSCSGWYCGWVFGTKQVVVCNVYATSATYIGRKIVTPPVSPSLDTGNDGTTDWSFSSELNSTNSPVTVNLNPTAINNYLSTCTANSDGYCNVPLKFSVASSGILHVSNISVQYPHLHITQAGTDKQNYTIGESVIISATVKNESYAYFSADSVKAKITKPDASVEWLTLNEISTGSYEGSFVAALDGGMGYSIRIYSNKSDYVGDIAWLSTFYANYTNFTPTQSQPPTGWLEVTSDPSQANITLDGVPAGQTPMQILNVSAWRHTVHISKAGYDECAKVNIGVIANQANPVHCDLKVNVAPQKDGSDTVLSLGSIPDALSYQIHETTDRFSWNFSQYQETASSTIRVTGTDAEKPVKCYIVKVLNQSMGEYKSKIVAEVSKTFSYNPSKTNVNWISVPYDCNFKKASDIVAAIEPSGTNTKVSGIAKWDAKTQTSMGYGYVAGPGWIGTDFDINPGDGVYISLSGNSQSFDWNIIGKDSEPVKTFSYNPSKTNVNWLSIPYTGTYKKASDIVAAIEPSSTNTKISGIAKWDAKTQTSMGYGYVAGPGWIGTDFDINPGDGIYISLSGNSQSFDWTVDLVPV